ncbi:MAG: VOC family protein [Bryobacteraceae bacterium]
MLVRLCIAALAVACVPLVAQQPKRPRITGVAHVAYFVHDIEKSREFYKDFLGYEEPFDLKNKDGSLSLTFIKVNDRQYIELFPESAPGTDRLNHISVETDDLEAMRLYLASKGVKVPDKVPTGRIGNYNFTIKDPDGHGVEFVQYAPGGWSVRDKGRFLGKNRISPRILHTGIIVGSVQASLAFYRDLLGFQEFWRGSRNEKVLDWMNLRVPDGDDYIEFMLYDKLPEPTQRGTQHHICLVVEDMDKAVAELRRRSAHYEKPIEIRTGINRRRQANLYDPDGTRTELMEPRTVDGVAAKSSKAPPPRP